MSDWDIVKALRNRAEWQTATGITEPSEHIDWMAADEIDRLRIENALLRDATLEEAAQEIERVGHGDYPNKLITDGYASAVRSLKTHAAAAALKETGDE